MLFGYRDVNISVWHESGEEVAVRALDEVAAGRIARFPRGVSGVQLVMHNAGMPTAGARAALVEAASRWAGRTAAVAVVIEQAGFFGSAMRSAVTGIQMLAKAEFPIKVFGTTRNAAEWLAPLHAEKTGTLLDPTRFDAALQKARTIRAAPLPSASRASGHR